MSVLGICSVSRGVTETETIVSVVVRFESAPYSVCVVGKGLTPVCDVKCDRRVELDGVVHKRQASSIFWFCTIVGIFYVSGAIWAVAAWEFGSSVELGNMM